MAHLSELKSSIQTIADTIEGLPASDPHEKMMQGIGLIAIGLIGEFLLDVKRIADATERLAATTEERNG